MPIAATASGEKLSYHDAATAPRGNHRHRLSKRAREDTVDGMDVVGSVPVQGIPELGGRGVSRRLRIAFR